MRGRARVRGREEKEGRERESEGEREGQEGRERVSGRASESEGGRASEIEGGRWCDIFLSDTHTLTHIRFAVEDSEDSIMFDEKDSKSPGGGPGPLIKAGTIFKLVERLTYHEYAGELFIWDAFIRVAYG